MKRHAEMAQIGRKIELQRASNPNAARKSQMFRFLFSTKKRNATFSPYDVVHRDILERLLISCFNYNDVEFDTHKYIKNTRQNIQPKPAPPRSQLNQFEKRRCIVLRKT